MSSINPSQAANNVLSSLARTESADKKAEETTQSRFLKMLTTEVRIGPRRGSIFCEGCYLIYLFDAILL